MIKELQQLLDEWDIHVAYRFHNNIYINIGPEDQYMWKRTENGVFMWKQYKAFFFHNNGMVYKLTNWEKVNDWANHANLYKISSNNQKFCIEKPIEFQTFEHNKELWLYYVVQRPWGRNGCTFMEDILREHTDTEYFLKLVDDHSSLLKYLKILNSMTKCNLPAITPKRIIYNDMICWTDFKDWSLTPSQYIANTTASIYHSMLAIESMTRKKLNKKAVIERITDTWK
jgi:hypothetical protein